jgi:hypothetical protein
MIENQNMTALQPDQARGLKRAGRNGNARPADTQHHRQELLGHRQVFTVNPVTDHQQPARKPFRQIVPGVAGGHLGGLNQEELDIALASVSRVADCSMAKRSAVEFMRYAAPATWVNARYAE